MITFCIADHEKDLIIYNLLSERYKELESKPGERDEKAFEQIEYLYNFYQRKIRQNELKR